MRKRLFIATVGLGLAFTACGKKKKDDPAPAGTGGTVSPSGNGGGDAAGLAADTEASTTVVGAQMDEAAAALNAGDSASNASASGLVNDTGLTGAITRTRACAADATAKTATVTLTYDGNASFGAGKATVTETAGGKEVRVWSAGATAVVCTADAKHAKIAWKSATAVGTAVGFNGLTLADTTTRTRALSTSFVNKKGETKTRSVSATENGTRNVTWTGTDATSTTKTVALDVTKTYTLTKFDGTTKDLGGEHKTVDPLVVTTVRDAAGVPTKHTISKGTLAVKKAGAFYVTNAFAGVVYDLAGTDPCTPVSGTITTNIYKSDAAADMVTAMKTLTITFDASGTPAVAGDDAATDNLNASINKKCDLKDGD